MTNGLSFTQVEEKLLLVITNNIYSFGGNGWGYKLFEALGRYSRSAKKTHTD